MKLLKYLQYVYVVFAAVFLYDAIANWSVDRNRSYMSLFFVVLAVFMYFFRKKYSTRFMDRDKNR